MWSREGRRGDGRWTKGGSGGPQGSSRGLAWSGGWETGERERWEELERKGEVNGERLRRPRRESGGGEDGEEGEEEGEETPKEGCSAAGGPGEFPHLSSTEEGEGGDGRRELNEVRLKQ